MIHEDSREKRTLTEGTDTENTMREAPAMNGEFGDIIQRVITFRIFGRVMKYGYHFGIRVAWDTEKMDFIVIHSSPFNGGCPVRCTESEFADGLKVKVSEFYRKRMAGDRDGAVRRALSAVGSKDWAYKLRDANCEGFVYWCATGKQDFKGVQSTVASYVGKFLMIGIDFQTPGSRVSAR